MNLKPKVAFCKFAGLASGGIEKYLQSFAMMLKDEGYEVDYYYTNAAPIKNTSWVHPPNDSLRKKIVEDYGIKTIKVEVGYRVHNTWHESNFFDVFDESKYDLLITGGNGEPEYPYTELNNIKIVHTVHGDHVFNKGNIVKSILICNWQAQRWLKNGGEKSKLEIIPPIVKNPETYPTNFREKHNIPQDAFVFGMHQRDDPHIFHPVCLSAFSALPQDNSYMVIMGGSNLYREFAKDLPPAKQKKIIFVDFCSDALEIHNFLDSIDVYAHSRLDGEVCSAAIIEGMSYGKPVVSCPGQNNGHEEQIKECGFFCNTIEDYTKALHLLSTDNDAYKKSCAKTQLKYNNIYSFSSVKEKIKTMINNTI